VSGATEGLTRVISPLAGAARRQNADPHGRRLAGRLGEVLVDPGVVQRWRRIYWRGEIHPANNTGPDKLPLRPLRQPHRRFLQPDDLAEAARRPHADLGGEALAIAEDVGVTRQAVAVWEEEFARILAADNFAKPHDFTAPIYNVWKQQAEIAEAVGLAQPTVVEKIAEFIGNAQMTDSDIFRDFTQDGAGWR
jgi:hypothetical protein